MNDKIRKGLNAAETLRGILISMRESVKAAREPFEDDILDHPAIIGELIDLEGYIQMAEREISAINASSVEMLNLIERLQARFHALHHAYNIAIRENELLGSLNAGVDLETLELLLDAAKILTSMSDEERGAAYQQIRLALSS